MKTLLLLMLLSLQVPAANQHSLQLQPNQLNSNSGSASTNSSNITSPPPPTHTVLMLPGPPTESPVPSTQSSPALAVEGLVKAHPGVDVKDGGSAVRETSRGGSTYTPLAKSYIAAKSKEQNKVRL